MSTERHSLPVTVYSSESQLRYPGKMIQKMFTDLWMARELAWRLIIRDISAQYRQAFLGIAWALIIPLVNTATWLFLNSTSIITVETTDLPYPIYIFTGSMLWQIFVEAFQSPNNQVNNAKSMLSKVNLPKEAIILSGIGQTIFNAGIKLLLLLPVLLIFRIVPGWGLLLLPLGMLSLILAGTSLGLLLVPIGALYQDVGRATGLITQFWMYITPVVFPLPTTGWVTMLFAINPLTPLILTNRSWLTGSVPTHLVSFWVVNGTMLLLLCIGWVLFRVSMPILIERMNA